MTDFTAAMSARIVVFLAACLMLWGCVGDEPEADAEAESRVKVGDPVPAFTVTLNDGTVFTSPDDLTGRETVLAFFTTTCPDCQAALPLWQKEYEAGRRIVCISRAESAADVAAYWEANALTMPYAAVADRSVYNLFAKSLIPRTYTVSATGVVTAITAE